MRGELCGVSLDYEIGARFDTFIYERFRVLL